MGASFSSIKDTTLLYLGPHKTVRVLMIGLEYSGKTTILYQLKLGEVVGTIPTTGYNVESLDYKKTEFVIWDLGGQDRLRAIRHHYYRNTQALICVVDAGDRYRIQEAKDRIDDVLSSEELVGVPLLVLANKQDLPSKVPLSELTQRLGLFTLRGRNWHIQRCCALSRDGLLEGLDWLAAEVTK